MAFTPVQKKMMDALLKLEGAVNRERDPFADGIDTPSPTWNFCFDNTWLMPQGTTMLLGGEPKAGKSIMLSSIIGKMHQDDPEAVAFKVDTEGREEFQVTPAQIKLWGIDVDRYRVIQRREPAGVFDTIEQEVPKLVQAGIKVKLVAIDSVNDIIGRRTANSDTVDDQQIADRAATIQDGLSRIKGVLKRHGVSMILTSQVRTDMDQLEQKRGNKVRFAVSWAVKHQAEFFVKVERLRTVEGRKDLRGNEDAFKDESFKDAEGEADEAAHKIRVTMVDNSLGRPGRVGIFTLHHDLGIVNKHEEVFLLGKGFGVLNIEGSWYVFGDRKWQGKDAALDAIRDEKDLYDSILKACKAKDLARKAGVVGQ